MAEARNNAHIQKYIEQIILPAISKQLGKEFEADMLISFKGYLKEQSVNEEEIIALVKWLSYEKQQDSFASKLDDANAKGCIGGVLIAYQEEKDQGIDWQKSNIDKQKLIKEEKVTLYRLNADGVYGAVEEKAEALKQQGTQSKSLNNFMQKLQNIDSTSHAQKNDNACVTVEGNFGGLGR